MGFFFLLQNAFVSTKGRRTSLHFQHFTASFPENESVAEHQNRQDALCHRAAVARL